MTKSPEMSEMLKGQLWRLHNRDYVAEDQEIEQLLMQQRELMEERLRRGYEELKDQPRAVWEALAPTEEAVELALYGVAGNPRLQVGQ